MSHFHEAQIKELKVEILSLFERLKRSKASLENYLINFKEFKSVFTENSGLYIVGGIVCLGVLVFDYWVSKQSLEYLANIVRVPSGFLAILFSIVDGFLAILASGLFAGHDVVKRKRYKLIGTIILFLMGIIKLILFVILVYNYNPEMEFFDERFNSVVFPQAFFVALVYLILKFFGSGLWYIFGHLWFAIYKTLIDNPNLIIDKIRKHFMSMENLVKGKEDWEDLYDFLSSEEAELANVYIEINKGEK